MISNYARKESINMNSNTDCYPSGPPGLTRSMSVAPSFVPDEDTIYGSPPGLTRRMSVAPSFDAEQHDQETIYSGPPGLTRSMSVAPSTDMDIHLDLGEGGEYDTMRDIGGMKQLGLASRDEINIFNDYVSQLKSQLLDHYAETSNILEELGERGWLIQNLHELLGEYTHRNRLVPTDFEAEQPLMDICPPALTRSITISIPSAMDVDQPKGPVALTRSINTSNDIFGFTDMASPLEPNRDLSMDTSIEEE